jgi:hypothetical protein
MGKVVNNEYDYLDGGSCSVSSIEIAVSPLLRLQGIKIVTGPLWLVMSNSGMSENIEPGTVATDWKRVVFLQGYFIRVVISPEMRNARPKPTGVNSNWEVEMAGGICSSL